MKIQALWFWDGDERNAPELLTAWDQDSVDGNPDGFKRDVSEMTGSRGDGQYREVDIFVSADSIRDAFKTKTVEGKV